MQDNMPLSNFQRKKSYIRDFQIILCPDYIYCRLLSFFYFSEQKHDHWTSLTF